MEERVVIIVQARMGSTRLPGKSLMPIQGKPLVGYVLERAKQAVTAHQLVLATTDQVRDNPLASYAETIGVPVFRGSENHVLSRYREAARFFNAGTIVRISGDCPLIDPQVIDQAILLFKTKKYDYVSNVIHRTYPRGMDVEVFSRAALEKAFHEATGEGEKEHVTPYFYRHPELFSLGSLEQAVDQSNWRLTVDTEEDLALIIRLMQELVPLQTSFTLQDIVEVLDSHPDWLSMNAHVRQKEVL